MRTLRYIAGLLVVAAVSMGQDKPPVKPAVVQPPFQYGPSQTAPFDVSASYDARPDTAYATPGTLNVKRRLKFEYPGSKWNDAHTKLARVEAAVITEYLPNGNSEDYDCRIVARDMVLNLIGSVVESTFDSELREDGIYRKFGHLYTHRTDPRIYKNENKALAKKNLERRKVDIEEALALKALSEISIAEVDKDENGDSYPAVFRSSTDCQEKTLCGPNSEGKIICSDPFALDTPKALCGQLTIRYRAIPTIPGTYLANGTELTSDKQRAYVFNKQDCRNPKYIGKMAFDACILLPRVKQCGLIDVERGLDARLREIIREEGGMRQEGIDTEDDETSPPVNFEEQYKNRGVPRS